MKRVRMLILIAVATTTQASVALAADKASQEDVPDAPTSGLDLDLSQTLSAAEHATQSHQNERALTLLLPVFAAPNRFSLAQQKLLLPRSVLSLRRAAEGAVAQGNMQLALKGFDTAWQLDAKADRVYATALVTAAERERSENPSAALWLVRRARIVDPSYEAASDRDRAWSHNQLAPYGYGLLIAGLASVVAGIACSWLSYSAENDLTSSMHERGRADQLLHAQHNFGLAAGITFGAGAAAWITGLTLLAAGDPKHEPRSPAYLPAVKEASR